MLVGKRGRGVEGECGAEESMGQMCTNVKRCVLLHRYLDWLSNIGYMYI